jgi:hypothetical protein
MPQSEDKRPFCAKKPRPKINGRAAIESPRSRFEADPNRGPAQLGIKPLTLPEMAPAAERIVATAVPPRILELEP